MEATRTKPGTHGTLYRYTVTYLLDDGVTSKWSTWAYDRDHAIAKFCNGDGWDYSDIVSVARA